MKGGPARASPFILLILSLASIAWCSQGLRLVDTLCMLTGGVVAGAALAVLAARRRRAP